MGEEVKYFTPKETQSRVEELSCYARQVKPTPPEFLFHYTTPAGLLGIVSSETMWMSDSLCMNDEKELLYFQEIVQQVAQNICTNNASAQLSENHKKLVSEMGNFITAQVGSIFLVSLSEHRDQLSQWRAYTSGAPGYALGFRGAELAKSALSADMTIGKCSYDRREAVAAANEIIRNFVSEFLENDQPVLDHQSIAYEFNRTVHMIAPFFKHPAFVEESEWRIFCYLHWQDSRLQYRPTSTQIVPYIPFYFGSLTTPASSDRPNFLLIPGPGMRYIATAGQGIFHRYLKSNVAVGKSEIPYIVR